MRKLIILICLLLTVIGVFLGDLRFNYIEDFCAEFGFFKGTVLISGKVTTRKLDPLEGVDIEFVRDGGGITRKATTDANGNFNLKVPKEKSGVLMLNLAGYRTITQKDLSYNDKVLNFEMHPDSVTGKVVDWKGKAIESAELAFEKDGGRAGIATCYSDGNGNYEIQIPEDQVIYWVTVKKDGYSTIREKIFGIGGQIYNFEMRK